MRNFMKIIKKRHEEIFEFYATEKITEKEKILLRNEIEFLLNLIDITKELLPTDEIIDFILNEAILYSTDESLEDASSRVGAKYVINKLRE